MAATAPGRRIRIGPLLFTASLVPLVLDLLAFASHGLGRDPYRALIRNSGVWSLWFLAFTLALTPLRRLTAWQWLATQRRLLGLFAFFYATVHTLAYVVFDRVAGLALADGVLSWSSLAELTISTTRDVWEKPFLAIGVAAYIVMVPLALTSSAPTMRAMGGRRWRRLHRLVYGVAIASLLHHWWPVPDRVRFDAYALLILGSLALRLAWAVQRLRPDAGASGASASAP